MRDGPRRAAPRREVGQERAVALAGHRLAGVHVQLAERGSGDHREGVPFRAEPAQRPGQLGAGARVAEGVAGHAYVGRAPGKPGQAVLACRDDHVLPHRSGLGTGGAGSRVNADLSHARRPQQHRAVERFERRGAVAGALRGDPHAAGAGVPDRVDHVGGRPGLHNNRGALVHGQVPRLARLVVAGLARDENLARNSRPQRFQVAVGNGVLDVHCFLLSFVGPAQGYEILGSRCSSLLVGVLDAFWPSAPGSIPGRMGRSLTRTPVAALDDLGGGPRPSSPGGSTPRCSGYCVR
ncbi:MAG TPA: hypothetical protein VIY52_31900 [Streptosporangiaceae bacterium]